MTSRAVISSPYQLSTVVKTNPELANIAAFAFVKELEECGTCSGKGGGNPKDFRLQYERAFSGLPSQDVARLKRVLGVERIGYYIKKPNGQLDLKEL